MRFCLLIGIVWTTLAVLSPASLQAGELAFADEKGEAGDKVKDHGEKKADHGTGGHGEKKDDLFLGSLDLALWTIVVFLVLLAVLYKFAWPHVAEGLDRREAAIAADREEARLAKEEATRAREELKAQMARANEEIRQMIEKARHDAEVVAAEQLAKGKEEMQRERERLNRELQTSSDQALQAIWDQAAQLATLVSAKTIRRHLTPEDHGQLVDEALGEFRAAAEERKRDYLSART